MAESDGNAELLNISEETGTPTRRIRGPEQLVAIHDKYDEHDKVSALERAKCQALIDGEAPFDSSELRDKGLTHVVNSNFGEASAIIEAAQAPYTEMVTGVPIVPNCVIDDPEGDAFEDSQIASEEFDWFLKQWGDFYANFQLLSLEFVKWGIGFAIWPDERTPFWQPCGLKDFKLARDTKISDCSIEMATVKRTLSVSELYRFIRNEKMAKALGWNCEAVKKAIWKASTKSDKWKNYRSHWEEFQREVKENDLYFGEAAYHRVELIYGYNKEFDNKYTQLIASRDADDFLYERPSKYNNVNSCFVAFTYGVGQGTVHSIRGLGQKIYNSIQITNRLLCNAAQGALASSQIQLTGDPDAIQQFQYIEVGPYTFIPKGLEPIQLMPSTVATQGLPIYNQLSQTLQNNTGSYRNRSTTPDGQSRSATEVAQQARQESTLSAAAISNFYVPYDKLLSDQFRRLVCEDLTQYDLGGELAMEFRRRCMARGVSLARLRSIKRVQAVRAIGNGSPVISEMTSRQLMEMYSLMDEKGKETALRTVIAMLPGVGWSKVDMFVPRGEPRRVIDFDIANLENGNLQQGIQPMVNDSQNHPAHLSAHIPYIASIVEAHRSQQMGDDDAMRILRPAADHATEHLVLFSNNSFRQHEVAQMKKDLQNVTAYVDELEQQVINRIMSEQNKLQQEAGQQAPQDSDMAKQQFELQKYQLQLAAAQEKRIMNQESHAQKLETIRQQMALADLKTKSSILDKTTRPAGRPPIIEQQT